MAKPPEFLDELPTADSDSGVPDTLPDAATEKAAEVEGKDTQTTKTTKTTESKKRKAKKPAEKAAKASKPKTTDTSAKAPIVSEASETELESGSKEEEAPAMPAEAVETKETVETVQGTDETPEQGDLTETKMPVVLGSGKLPHAIVHQWDTMLSSVTAPTRNAIWEQAITGMEQLLRTPRSDLQLPKGKLTEQQIVEVEKYLNDLGYCLPAATDLRGSGRSSFTGLNPVASGSKQKRREARNERLLGLANCR